MKIKRYLKWTLICFLALAIIVQSIALIRCEILTRQYDSDFQQAWKANTMLGEMEYFKVLECDGVEAKVYYVSTGMEMANVLSFQKNHGKWEEVGWETIWSKSGSASEIIWPYWWHFIYGGF